MTTHKRHKAPTDVTLTLTWQQLTDLDEVLTAAIQGFDPEMFESDSAYEDGLQDLQRWQALQELMQYHLS